MHGGQREEAQGREEGLEEGKEGEVPDEEKEQDVQVMR